VLRAVATCAIRVAKIAHTDLWLYRTQGEASVDVFGYTERLCNLDWHCATLGCDRRMAFEAKM
jgi:hypothetical protein